MVSFGLNDVSLRRKAACSTAGTVQALNRPFQIDFEADFARNAIFLSLQPEACL